MCSDPNNLPFSNQRQEGFENKLAVLVAADLGATVEYTWWAQRKSFVRNTLVAGSCDVIAGIPSNFPGILTTHPYYRSSYVFVTRAERGLKLTSLDDPRLKRLRIGTHVVGNDYAPPAYALARRGVVRNVTGFSLFGGYGEENPPARIFDALARADIDIAIVWGPLAGYFARKEPVPMSLAPVPQDAALGAIPFTFDVSLGVRPQDEALKVELDRALDRHREEVRRILDDYGVPQSH